MQPERYIFRAQPRREQLACDVLAKRSIAAVAPRTRTFERVTRKRLVATNQPVYRGYIFAEVASSQWGSLHEAPYISPRPLMADGRPYRMREAESADVDYIVRNPPPDPRDPNPNGIADPDAPPFKPGDTVKILDGPFFGFSATVEAVRAAGRKWKVKVEAKLFGRPTPIDLEAGALAPA